ncbi:MAG: hypothetical protein GF421_07610 [Candidatus Aminicenantes bacterium]|nr:hypothetical protein [Candidatus Aminicenantes bacterium]
MKNKPIQLILTIFVLTFVLTNFTPAVQKGAVTKIPLHQLNHVIKELPEGSPLDFSDDLFSFLDPIFSQAQIIALGEATHGTKEFFELKHRLLQYLVKNHNVRALGFEFDFRFGSSLNMERFVTEGKGDLDALFHGLYWTHRNQELKNMILWMQKYNSDKKDWEKIHFVGIDSQLDIWYINELIEELHGFDPRLPEYLKEELSPLKSLGKIDHKNMSSEKYSQIKSLLSQLKKQVHTYLTENPSPSDSQKRKLMSHLIESYLLSHEMRFLLTKKKNVRDRHMAEHCLWLKGFVEDHQKVAVWAHNSHVAKNPHYTSEGSPSMGHYLKRELGPAYISIATSFSKGSFAAVTDDCFGNDTKPIIWKIQSNPPPHSSNSVFHKAAPQNFVFLISSQPKQSELFQYFNQPMSFLGVGDFFTRDVEDHYGFSKMINLAQYYDILFHFKDTNAIHIIEKKDV